jgi:hypothetical protein
MEPIIGSEPIIITDGPADARELQLLTWFQFAAPDEIASAGQAGLFTVHSGSFVMGADSRVII